jgi:predicted hexulose-6-phosphate isomerase
VLCTGPGWIYFSWQVRYMTILGDLLLGLYEKAVPLSLSWEEKFSVVRDSGYDFIELSVDGLSPRIERLDWTPAQIGEVRRCIEQFDMPIYTMALTANRYFPLGDEREDIRKRGIDIVRKAVDLAVRLGIRTVQLAAYDVFERESTPENDSLFIDSLKRTVEYAATRSVTLCLEVMDVEYSNTPQKLMRFIGAVGSPYLQIYADIGNPVAAGRHDTDELLAGGRHILGVHIKDTTYGMCRDILFGEGEVDFLAAFRSLRKMGFRGLLVAEMWCKEDMAFVPYLKTASVFIREKIKIADSIKLDGR